MTGNDAKNNESFLEEFRSQKNILRNSTFLEVFTTNLGLKMNGVYHLQIALRIFEPEKLEKKESAQMHFSLIVFHTFSFHFRISFVAAPCDINLMCTGKP